MLHTWRWDLLEYRTLWTQQMYRALPSSEPLQRHDADEEEFRRLLDAVVVIVRDWYREGLLATESVTDPVDSPSPISARSSLGNLYLQQEMLRIRANLYRSLQRYSSVWSSGENESTRRSDTIVPLRRHREPPFRDVPRKPSSANAKCYSSNYRTRL